MRRRQTEWPLPTNLRLQKLLSLLPTALLHRKTMIRKLMVSALWLEIWRRLLSAPRCRLHLMVMLQRKTDTGRTYQITRERHRRHCNTTVLQNIAMLLLLLPCSAFLKLSPIYLLCKFHFCYHNLRHNLCKPHNHIRNPKEVYLVKEDKLLSRNIHYFSPKIGSFLDRNSVWY